jgi:hypothetical protein
LPDCSTIIYDTSLISAPFRGCDLSNFGVSQVLISPTFEEILFVQIVMHRFSIHTV